MLTYNEIKECLNNGPLLKNDLYATFTYELATFLRLEDLPKSYTDKLSEEAKEHWNDNFTEDTVEELNADIKEELRFLKAIIDEQGHPSLARMPRVIALLFVRDNDKEWLQKMDEYLQLAWKKPTKTRMNDLIKTIKQRV